MELNISTRKKRQVIDLTDEIAERIPPDFNGVVSILVRHTTAALTTADLDPGTDQDLLDALDKLLPDLDWRHPHNPKHAPDHLLASIIGPGTSIPARNGQLILGTWQRIILLEFDGPRERNIELTLLAAAE